MVSRTARCRGNITKGAGNADIIKDVSGYFDDHVINGLINPQKLEIVINAMSDLIKSDDMVGEDVLDYWIRLRDESDFGSFLAYIFLYAVPQSNSGVMIDQEIVAPELDDEDTKELKMFETNHIDILEDKFGSGLYGLYQSR